MAKMKLSESSFSLIPEGITTFKIMAVDDSKYEDFGILVVKMQTAKGETHSERFTLMKENGEVNEGALKAWSYFARVWDTAVPTGEAGAYAPEPNLHFLYLMCHTAKHIINNGMGFRAFLDMVFMTREERGLDWTFLEAELERLQLLDFTRTCFALCRRWFGVEMPLPAGPLEKAFFEEVTDKVFRDGTFGLHNEQNEAAHSAKELSRAEAPYWQTALALTWRKLFPPYRDMQLVPWYHFVDGRPWLLPAAWVYRWFYTARHKFSQSKALLAEPFAKRSVIEERKQLIDRWGL